ncbi:PDR/VanB family oxidoreductase [Nocardia asteroides]|uniref:PDR/VanB family oxidoreductase n=1 Tax=Nocardia asteroides TaxID=1824 RepID=UPI00378C80F1
MRWSALIHRSEFSSPVNDHRLPLVVTDLKLQALDTDVLGIELAAPSGGALPQWHPGAHLDLELPSGRVRQYSLCGDPRDSSRYRIAVRRIPDGGGGSVEAHQALRIGTVVTARGPRNAFSYVPPGCGTDTVRTHFVAGGIGITPILPMIGMADRLGVPWSMVYVGRSRATIPFLDELAPYGDRVVVRTDDEHGIPTGKDLLDGVGPDTSIFCCGPTAMTSAVARRAQEIPGVELHAERFSAPPVVDGSPFSIELARSGEIIDVAADTTALAAVLEARPDTPYSCRQGFCRSCVVRVIDGQPDHRETVLTTQEHSRGAMLLCVSRCHGPRLVLDL